MGMKDNHQYRYEGVEYVGKDAVVNAVVESGRAVRVEETEEEFGGFEMDGEFYAEEEVNAMLHAAGVTVLAAITGTLSVYLGCVTRDRYISPDPDEWDGVEMIEGEGLDLDQEDLESAQWERDDWGNVEIELLPARGVQAIPQASAEVDTALNAAETALAAHWKDGCDIRGDGLIETLIRRVVQDQLEAGKGEIGIEHVLRDMAAELLAVGGALGSEAVAA